LAVKFLSAKEAVSLIKDGDTVAINAFVGLGHPEELLVELENRFLETGHPRDLTVFHVDGAGLRDLPIFCNRFAHEGMIKKYIAGHWDSVRKVVKLATENKIEAYCMPQGEFSRLLRAIAAGAPGIITHVGLNTFVDPRIEGGKLNEISKEEFCRIIEIDGKEYLFYKSFPINVALIRGTTADKLGNITMEKEPVFIDAFAMACACHNSGGIVIVQVERIAEAGTLNPQLVKIPGILVDVVVRRTKKQYHQQIFGQVPDENYNPALCGEIRVPPEFVEETEVIGPDGRIYTDPPILPMGIDKIICRRAALELKPDVVVNLGIGKPEGVAKIANEENIADVMTLTVEAGAVGGIPGKMANFGSSLNPYAIVNQNEMFDFYDGGGLDIAFLGMAQVDSFGNINVSKVGKSLIGAGGFINITQNAKEVVFVGTFTLGGLQIEIKDGKLKIVQEGKFKKFFKKVEQITFSGEYAKKKGQKVLYVTERAVFELRKEGMTLIEIAPGIDLEKDILENMEFKPIISPDLKEMDPRIFREEKMNIREEILKKGK
jgi:propionate CoA-transferase